MTVARLETLDALRGIAALSVVASHIIFVMPSFTDDVAIFSASTWADPAIWFRYTPLRAFVGGPAAVIIFFLLSGFVLSLAFLSGKAVGYRSFIWRRFCRIYIPFIVAILLAAALFQYSDVNYVPFVSDWFNNDSWSEPLTPALLLGHVLMFGTKPEMSLNNVMWSLVHEVRISIMFPAIMIMVMRSTRWSIVVSLLLLLLSGVLHRIIPGAVADTWLDTLWYIPFFVAGALIARHRNAISIATSKLGRRFEWLAVGVAIVLLAIPAGVPFAELPYGVAGAMLIILAVAGGEFAKLMGASLFQWLGRVSYSLYLVHLPIILTMVHLLAGMWPLSAILALSLLASLTVAELMYRAVERPSIALGRRGLWLRNAPKATAPGAS